MLKHRTVDDYVIPKVYNQHSKPPHHYGMLLFYKKFQYFFTFIYQLFPHPECMFLTALGNGGTKMALGTFDPQVCEFFFFSFLYCFVLPSPAGNILVKQQENPAFKYYRQLPPFVWAEFSLHWLRSIHCVCNMCNVCNVCVVPQRELLTRARSEEMGRSVPGLPVGWMKVKQTLNSHIKLFHLLVS